MLNCDIRKFFASIDHAILVAKLRRHIDDKDIVELLQHVVESFHSTNNPEIGLLLGNLSSQLLMIFYMDHFDQFAIRTLKVRHYIRYADDFVFLHENKPFLQKLLPEITYFLRLKLKLTLHPKKVTIHALASGVAYLGWVHFSRHRVLRTAMKRRIVR